MGFEETVCDKPETETEADREELVRRVEASPTFEKSPRLRAFLLHVCRCALENKPEEATEQQIGIYVYGRAPGYNPNDDNIVRSQARLLRMKLEHHFGNDGKSEPFIITIPKGHYLPVFQQRAVQHVAEPVAARPRSRFRVLRRFAISGFVIVLLVLVGISVLLLRQKSPIPSLTLIPSASASGVTFSLPSLPASLSSTSVSGVGEIRIAVGRIGAPYVDLWGRRWEPDRYFDGGVSKPGPKHFFPPVPDEGLFATMREAVSADLRAPQSERAFRYDIPLPSGVFELRLYFADPIRQPETNQREDSENLRHIEVDINGHPSLLDLDPIADAGAAAVDVRVFKDLRPSDDGKLHLEFRSRWGHPAFLSAIEVMPGTAGILRPIRISAHPSAFLDSDGTRWSGDNYYINGRTFASTLSRNEVKIPPLYSAERHGNFSYSIPVTPGKYTVKLHFMESFFSPLVPEAYCNGAGCRVFDVSCNGELLLKDFDIYQASGGAFRPIVREFHGLRPNGQGKLLLSFSPQVNYAEVRAIEVIDEAN